MKEYKSLDSRIAVFALMLLPIFASAQSGLEDTYEDDSDPANAVHVNNGDRLGRSFATGASEDIDWIAFTLPATGEVAIEATHEIGLAVTIEIFNSIPPGTAIVAGTDFITTFLSSGTYWTRFREATARPADRYEIDYSYDIHESNDNAGSAVLIPLDILWADQSMPFGDSDWFTFSVATASHFAVAAHPFGGGLAFDVYSGPSEAPIKITPDAAPASFPVKFYEDISTGSYFLKLEPGASIIDWGRPTAIPAYSLEIQDTSGLDAYEDDDVIARATIVDPFCCGHVLEPRPQLHNFHDAGDEDWHRLGGFLDDLFIITENLGSDANTRVDVFDGNLNLIFSASGDVYYDDPEESGTRYIRIRNQTSTSFGEKTAYVSTIIANVTDSYKWFTISGRVLDAETELPIEGATITGETNFDDFTSDEDGYYGFGGEVDLDHFPGPYLLSASVPGYETSTHDVYINSADTAYVQSFSLTPTDEFVIVTPDNLDFQILEPGQSTILPFTVKNTTAQDVSLLTQSFFGDFELFGGYPGIVAKNSSVNVMIRFLAGAAEGPSRHLHEVEEDGTNTVFGEVFFFGISFDKLNVWVDRSWTGDEVGLATHPLKQFETGLNEVKPGGTLHLMPGTYNRAGPLSKPMRIVPSLAGTVRIEP